jgi:hypothetical protein
LDKPITHVQIHRALKVILGINYRFHWLDAYISPERTEWYVALQFRNDPQRKWRPRCIYFYPQVQTVAVFDQLGGEPAWVSAKTILEMAEKRTQSPTPTVS